MGVAAYVDEPFGEYKEPSFFTITEQFGEEMGKTVARKPLKQIFDAKKSKNQVIAIPPKLIVRKSSFR